MKRLLIFKTVISADSFIKGSHRIRIIKYVKTSRASLIGLLAGSILSSCAFTPYNTQFDCPVGKGEPCTRLSTINKLIDRGELGVEENETPKGLMCGPNCAKKFRSPDVRVTYFSEKKPETIIVEEPTPQASEEQEGGTEPHVEEPNVLSEEFQA